MVSFAEAKLAEDATLRPRDLVDAINEAFGVVVHPRSVERALARRRVPKSGQR